MLYNEFGWIRELAALVANYCQPTGYVVLTTDGSMHLLVPADPNGDGEDKWVFFSCDPATMGGSYVAKEAGEVIGLITWASDPNRVYK